MCYWAGISTGRSSSMALADWTAVGLSQLCAPGLWVPPTAALWHGLLLCCLSVVTAAEGEINAALQSAMLHNV